jgi:hypothetical protein
MGNAAQLPDSPGVVGVRSVGKIQARNIHAQAHQVANHFLGIARRANRADDFCATHASDHIFQRRGGRRQIAFNQIQFAFFQVANPLSRKFIPSDFTGGTIWELTPDFAVSELRCLPVEVELS